MILQACKRVAEVDFPIAEVSPQAVPSGSDTRAPDPGNPLAVSLSKDRRVRVTAMASPYEESRKEA